MAIGGGQNATAAPQATAQGGIAVGSSSASGVNGARATAANAVAIGSGDGSTAGASATHSNSIVFGIGTASSGTNQMNIGTKRMFAGAPNSAAADGDLVNSQWTAYLDQTLNNWVVKAKYSDGTVKTAVLAMV